MTGLYVIDRDAYRALAAWCRRSPRREIGGVLAGAGRYIARAAKVPNRSPCPTCCFEWNEREAREARRQLRAEGLNILGQWHSHRWYARPSRADLAYHSGIELIWSCHQGRPRLWRLRGTMRQVLRRGELRLVVGELVSRVGARWSP